MHQTELHVDRWANTGSEAAATALMRTARPSRLTAGIGPAVVAVAINGGVRA